AGGIIPIALFNIAGILVGGVFKNPTPAGAHAMYKYSIAFPYVAGAVAGVQLVVSLTFGFWN
ncbi:MAG: prenyltransferase, partial [Microbacteriaceae bacterium]